MVLNCTINGPIPININPKANQTKPATLMIYSYIWQGFICLVTTLTYFSNFGEWTDAETHKSKMTKVTLNFYFCSSDCLYCFRKRILPWESRLCKQCLHFKKELKRPSKKVGTKSKIRRKWMNLDEIDEIWKNRQNIQNRQLYEIQNW